MLNNRINITKSIEVAGRNLSFNVGSLATQANGSVFVRYGDTCVLVTATASEEPREGIDFLPLTVDYEERLYAVGKIPGGFIKREGKPSEKATLSSRLIDRPLRPLFPKGFHNDIHIVATVLSVDQDNRPDVTAINGASAALMISDIPFENPIGAVWVGKIGNDLIINPTLEQWEKSELDLVIAGTEEAVVMVEAEASEVPEDIIIEAIELAHKEIKNIVRFIKDLRQECLKEGIAKEKKEVSVEPIDKDLESEVYRIGKELIAQAIDEVKTKGCKKLEREKILKETKEEIVNKVMELKPELFEEDPNLQKRIEGLIVEIEKEIVRSMILEKKERIDNRKLDEIRPIECKVGILPRTHGSGLFVRGETQVLTVSTLGALGEEQILDGIDVEETKRYMHHYNFPPYSVGEARPIRGPGRREIGHGALAERALERVLPSEDEFPYTIRLVSEVLESNGSTSMASVCGSTLALMDAGVPIKAPVAGIAMGLIKEGDKVEILTDIQGIEDALGDMDFKVAGTKKGITALQMDIKIAGINTEILKRALEQARKARLIILDKIIETIPEPRPTLSPYAPRIIKTEIDPEKIRDIIGPGGKIIKKIIDETGVKIDIEDDGKVYIAAVDQSGAEKALEMIKSLTEDVEIGKIYLGKVTRTTDFGAFVEVIPGVMGLPGKEGMVHISQLAEERVNKVEDVVKAGDKIIVKAIGFDQLGRLKLSRKEALKEANKEAEKNIKNKTKKFREHRKNK
ncbi:MAG: Polyribonucleotide nucleotidyltransferase [Clostridia bacterium 41_269]|nr:MAG: Polyribonucleotide nucleotidyltransferase [Clostridia bacterium 41_269]